jgi:cyclophilin family peptidyl-prolyl cis-trans isomerase
VLSRVEVGGPERKLYARLAADGDPLVRQAALEILMKRPELPRVETVLAALADSRIGVVIAAVELLAKAPSLASTSDAERPPDSTKVGTVVDVRPDDRVVAALKVALARGLEELEPELVDGAISAIGALGARALVPVVGPLCASAWPETRKRVEVAMSQLTGKAPTCSRPPGEDRAALAAPPPSARLRLETDAGPLVIALDGALAPSATTRFLDLARRGYFDGNVLHRVDPSYVVQFGSPDGDGYAGPKGDAPLRCETSPLPFEPLSVGVALSGRDTGKSQLFVMRARHPHIDGLYPLVGVAQGEWERVIEGDVIRKVSVEESP